MFATSGVAPAETNVRLQSPGSNHVAHLGRVDLHADGFRLRRGKFAELRADDDTLGEQRFHRDAGHDAATAVRVAL